MLNQNQREALQVISKMGRHCHGFAAPAMKLAEAGVMAHDVEGTRGLLHHLESEGYLRKTLSDAGVPTWSLTVKAVNEL
jgi:hypothetical protein